MQYTLLKISGREDASLDRYWIDPSGKEYYVNGFKGTHMMWIYDNLELLQPKEREEIARLGLHEGTIEKFAGVLYELGWVRISENVVLLQSNNGMQHLADFIARHKKDPNLNVDKDRFVTIITMSPESHSRMSIGKIMDKYKPKSMQLAASFGKISSRDAVKDTINYWDKAKNKDFSKYWRKLKKKKKANYIPNPDTKVPQPLKRNYDYGEIPNYVDRLRWFNKKERAKKRRADLDTL
jgi:hypothetical protein